MASGQVWAMPSARSSLFRSVSAFKTATGLTVQLLVGIAQTAHRIAPPAPHCIASHRTASHRSAPVAADAADLSRGRREETWYRN